MKFTFEHKPRLYWLCAGLVTLPLFGLAFLPKLIPYFFPEVEVEGAGWTHGLTIGILITLLVLICRRSRRLTINLNESVITVVNGNGRTLIQKNIIDLEDVYVGDWKRILGFNIYYIVIQPKHTSKRSKYGPVLDEATLEISGETLEVSYERVRELFQKTKAEQGAGTNADEAV